MTKKEKNLKNEEVNTEETVEETVEESRENAPENEAEPEKVEGTVEDAKPEQAESEKVAELTDRLQRLMAEFDNYRKRTEKEKASEYDRGMMKAIEKLLPVVDNFERGLKAVNEEEKGSPVYEGMDKIYKSMMKTLEDMGVQPIEAEGKEFDANLHNAVMQVENDAYGENIVVAELQKGYTYKGNVLRYSMVSVNK